MHLSVLLLTFIVFATNVEIQALNILGIFPYHGKSHHMVNRVLLLELANRGHSLTVISHFPEKDPPKNYKEIILASTPDPIEDGKEVHRSYSTIIDTLFFLTKTGAQSCEVMLANKEVQSLVNTKNKFDVAVVELFNTDCGLGLAYKLGIPVVSISTSVLMPWHYHRFGVPNNPSYVSFHFLEGGTRPTLFQRVERFFFDILSRTMYYYLTQRPDQTTLAKYFEDIPPLEDLAREIKTVLLCHNFVLTGSSLFPSNIIEVGGFQLSEKKPLTKDLEKFVQEAEHGVIYISFGSVIKSSSLTDEHMQAVLGAMAELPQRFIWKWESEILLADKNKLFVSKWLPQIDILGHSKTLAFWSHAGMGSTTEAIHFGVPVVAMPVLGDQPANAAAIEESGLGVQLAIPDLNKENLVAAFKTVLDPKFREKVKQLSRAWHDRPMPPLDAAVFWTEFAARNANFTFRTAAADVPFYQYAYLDILTVYCLIIFIPILLMRYVITLCSRTTKEHQGKMKYGKKKNKLN